MYKVSPPSSETRCFISEDFAIALCPNIPSGSKYHFRKEREAKVPPSRRSHHVSRLIWIRNPRDAKVVPYTLTEIASEEKMHTILMIRHVAQNTSGILHDPVHALHHVPGIQLVHQKKPTKDFDLESA